MKKQREREAGKAVVISIIIVAFFAFAVIGSEFWGTSPFDLVSVALGFVLGMLTAGLVWICNHAIERAKKRVV